MGRAWGMHLGAAGTAGPPPAAVGPSPPRGRANLISWQGRHCHGNWHGRCQAVTWCGTGRGWRAGPGSGGIRGHPGVCQPGPVGARVGACMRVGARLCLCASPAVSMSVPSCVHVRPQLCAHPSCVCALFYLCANPSCVPVPSCVHIARAVSPCTLPDVPRRCGTPWPPFCPTQALKPLATSPHPLPCCATPSSSSSGDSACFLPVCLPLALIELSLGRDNREFVSAPL